MRFFSRCALRLAGLLPLIGALGIAAPALAASLFHNAAQPLIQPPIQPAVSGTPGIALVPVSAPVPQSGAGPTGSLFAGRQGGGLFAPVLPRAERGGIGSGSGSGAGSAFTSALNIPAIVGLRSLIASVEAGPAQYDAVVFSARVKPPKPPTQMTVAEIYDWITATPGQNHAIGRYQFIPDTLRRVMREAGADPAARFSPALQDRLADVLLLDAGLPAFLGGHMAQPDFMNNLARIWAGLPNASGKSHYEGIAGNKAGMSWARFEREMTRLFPSARRVQGTAG